MNANQSYDLHFKVNKNGGYVTYQSRIPRKKESFWQKWKGWLLGGTAILSTAVLG